MLRSKPRFAASTNEASVHAARRQEYFSNRSLHSGAKSRCFPARACAIYDGLQDLLLFPYIGRRQQTKGVRKFVTHKYRYLVYYTVNDVADESSFST
jgi:hypothetical protein